MRPENEEAMWLAQHEIEYQGQECSAKSLATHVRRLVADNERMRKSLTDAQALVRSGMNEFGDAYLWPAEFKTLRGILSEGMRTPQDAKPTLAVEAKPKPGDILVIDIQSVPTKCEHPEGECDIDDPPKPAEKCGTCGQPREPWPDGLGFVPCRECVTHVDGVGYVVRDQVSGRKRR